MRTVLDCLTSIFLYCRLENTYAVVTAMICIFGIWGIFRKCGLRARDALIPCLREIRIGEAAGMEKEGRILAFLTGAGIILDLADLFLSKLNTQSGTFYAFCMFLRIFAGLMTVIFQIRIYLGLTEVFDRKKRWIILWVLAEWIPAVLWGWLKKYEPLWKAEELKNSAANYFSGSKAEVLDQGLTVNLEERTATEFFKKKYLLRDIHMYIQPGHMVLLLGGSGAGKTTYLNAVNGYEKAKAEVVLNGRNMYTNYKDMHGLAPVKNNLVVKLSGGQRKRLSIAMEFLSNPTLFILDEPDSGLDGVMARELFEQLRQIADQGKIIIVITHTPDRVIDLFDDVIVLAKDSNRTGRLAWFGPIEEARKFFGKEKMEEIVKSVNREEEGGEGRADEFILKYAEVQHV